MIDRPDLLHIRWSCSTSAFQSRRSDHLMHVSKGIEKRDIHVHIRCLVYYKLLPLHLHLDVNEIWAATKRLGSLGSQPHAAPFDAAWQTIELVEKSPHGFFDCI